MLLLIAVAGSMKFAAVAILHRWRQAPGISDCAGAILVAWIIAEAPIIPFSWPQSTFLGVGLLVIALGRPSAREICSVEPRSRDRVSPRPSA